MCVVGEVPVGTAQCSDEQAVYDDDDGDVLVDLAGERRGGLGTGAPDTCGLYCNRFAHLTVFLCTYLTYPYIRVYVGVRDSDLTTSATSCHKGSVSVGSSHLMGSLFSTGAGNRRGCVFSSVCINTCHLRLTVDADLGYCVCRCCNAPGSVPDGQVRYHGTTAHQWSGRRAPLL